MKTYALVSEKLWHRSMANALIERLGANFVLIDKRELFTLDNLKKISPEKIFIPHWSYFIPQEIYEPYECIVFHMTDLPYGRGGSPLQNLIVRGHTNTKISAIRVVKELDAGDIYIKRDLCLGGNAQEIFLRASKLIEEMIVEIVTQNILPCKQEGEVVIFKRRKPEDGDISNLTEIEKVYDYIRMLDADTYPKAFLETDRFRFEFSRASWQADKTILADVRIIPK
ncbi:MAG: methionyl-tRNA formyltransferase [Candidatus Bathyarchaeia archaeon]